MTFFEAGSIPLLQKAINQLEAKKAGNVEIDILLTILLQRLHEAGLMNRIVFKGGTMLRKMIFGKNGRLSTDLDFTVRSVNDNDQADVALEIMLALSAPYRGVSFTFADKEVGTTPTSSRANPHCLLEATQSRHLIKLEVSHRADPVLEPEMMDQQPQPYFGDLGFTPAAIPCLRLEEAMGEKIRAAFQRPKIRDLHDLQQLRAVNFNPEMVRQLAVIKLWESPEGVNFAPFSHEAFVSRLNDRAEQKAYNERDLGDLLLRKAQFDMVKMTKDVATTYAFLGELTETEKTLLADRHQHERVLYKNFREEVRTAGSAPPPP